MVSYSTCNARPSASRYASSVSYQALRIAAAMIRVRRGHGGSAKPPCVASSAARKSSHSASTSARSSTDFADRFGSRRVADRRVHRVMRRLPRLECRIVRDVGEHLARPAAAEAAHAMAHVEEERLALLFAVVADIDAGGDLLRHDLAHRRLATRSSADASIASPRQRRT